MNEDLQRFAEKYKETLGVLLGGKLLTEVTKPEARAAKKMAREDAFGAAPELRRPFDAYQAWLQRKRYHGEVRDMTAEEKLGVLVLNKMGRTCLENFHPPWARKRKSQKTKVAPVVEPTSLVRRYLEWIKEHDVAPPDDVLCFFIGCTRTNFQMARRDAREMGYEFAKVDGGMWKVTSRPLPEVQDLEEDEKSRLLRKVLAMPNLSDDEVVKILRKII